MIKSIEIKNYRCISYLKIENLKPINIFVGRNNTGKSSILEAIALVYSSPTGFLDAFGNDLLEAFIERRGSYDNIKYFIKNGGPEAVIKSDFNSEKLRLNIIFKEKGLLKKVKIDKGLTNMIISYIDENIKLEKRMYKIYDEKIEPREYWKLDRRDMWNDIIKSPKLFLISYKNNESLSRNIVLQDMRDIIKSNESSSFLMFDGKGISIDFIEMHNTLVSKGNIQYLIDILRKNLHIDDIRVANDELFIFQQNVSKPVPLGLMGDGFLALLRKMFIKMFLDRGIIILEEPENHMHPGYMEFMIEELSKTVNESDIQVFISTHSLELLRKFLDIKENKDILQIIRMYRDGEDIDYEVIDFEEAKESLEELEVDLRGI